MGRLKRVSFLILLDVVFANLAFIGSLLIRFENVPLEQWQFYVATFVPYTLIRLLSNHFFGIYRRAWRYASIDEVLAIVGAVSVGSVFAVTMCLFWFGSLPARSIVVLDWFLNIAFLGGSRFMWRLVAPFLNVLPAVQPNRPAAKNVLIIGAGDGGVLVARELRNHYKGEVRLVGFVDDDPKAEPENLRFPGAGNQGRGACHCGPVRS